MSAPIPRLRMFAGPNGSGKSTLKSYLPATLLGVYLNPDEIEQEIRKQGFLDFALYGVNTTADEARRFFNTSKFLQQADLLDAARQLTFADGRLDFAKVEVNSYLASVAGDFLRQNFSHRNSHSRLKLSCRIQARWTF